MMKSEFRKRRNFCLAVTAAVIIGIVLLIVILAFTVFKARRPVNTVDSVKLQNLHLGLNIARLSVDLNVTLGVGVSIYNPNKVGFKYTDSTALLNYRGQLVGEATVPAGEISAGKTMGMNLTLTIMADRLLSNSQLYSDVISGTLPLNTFIKLSGKVTVAGFIKIHVISSTSCDFAINTSNRTVEDKVCNYKTKL